MRILHIVPTLGYGGIASVVMDYYRIMSGNEFEIDFVTHGKKEDYHSGILEKGNKIHYIRTIKAMGCRNYFKEISRICNMGYDIVHIHTEYLSGFTAFMLRQTRYSGKIITHAHSANISNKYIRLFQNLNQILINKNSDVLLACSKEAGDYYYGKNKKYQILKNPVNYNRFINDDIDVEKVKQEIGIPSGKIILGHVGSFVTVKNHLFLLDVLCELSIDNDKFCLVLVGDGILRKAILHEVIKRGLVDKVVFLGKRSDVDRIYPAFDCFLFPSLNEGFGIAVAEAQASRKFCFVSTAVPQICDIGLNLVSFLEINQSAGLWKKAIMKFLSENKTVVNRNSVVNAFLNNDFDIESIGRNLSVVYKELVK